MIALESKSLSPELKAAVVDLLYRLADDSLIIGHRNSEWTGLGPILEEDIAFSSMSQDKMGHAIALFNLLHELGEADADTLAYSRTAREYRCCSLVALKCMDEAASGGAALSNNPVRDELLQRGDWVGSLIRQIMFAEADAVRMAALEESTFGPLAALARKFRGEIKYHTMHGRTILPRLGNASDESRERLQIAIDRLYPHALGLFEPTTHDSALSRAGICPPETELCKHWREQLNRLLAASQLRASVDAKPVYGGREGKHPPELSVLLDDMQKVYRLSPGATW